MSRKIKFRGLTLDGEWVYGYLISNGAYVWIQNKEGGNEAVIANTVGQYTGLKDRNGKEIYEGDIVSGTNGLYAFVVTYIRNSFIAVSTDGRDEFTIPDHWEVIGNIHQDKHLLS